jgi:CO/xanthine dehydrogenase FAD-binding subunit
LVRFHTLSAISQEQEQVMIIEYHKPATLMETLKLLSRSEPMSIPLGGGTALNQCVDPVAVVDLQNLGLNTIETKGNFLQIGATTTLQQLLILDIGEAMNTALRYEKTYNLRQVATIAGTLTSSTGRSHVATALLALDAELHVLPNDEKINLSDFLLQREAGKHNRLITYLTIPNNVMLAYMYVARTPADLPIVCGAVAQWPSRRTRVILGGFGNSPKLAMDGPDEKGADSAAMEAFREAGDQWASAAYRSEVAGILVRRCIRKISNRYAPE